MSLPRLKVFYGVSVALRIKSKHLTKVCKNGHNPALLGFLSLTPSIHCSPGPLNFLLFLHYVFSYAAISFFLFFAGLSLILQDSVYL